MAIWGSSTIKRWTTKPDSICRCDRYTSSRRKNDNEDGRFRQLHPEGRLSSWRDYHVLAFPRNNGLRLDYIFATQPSAQRCTSAEIDRQERKGSKPSDHASVIAVFGE